MFKGLRSWLFTSYTLIIVVCLAMVIVVFILAIAPIQARIITARLVAQLTPTTVQVRYLLRQGLTPQQIMERWQEQAGGQGADLLLLGPRGEVLAYSDELWAGQQMGELVRPGDPPGSKFPAGSLVGPDGRRRIYVAAPAGPLHGEGAEQRQLFVALVALRTQGLRVLLGDLGVGILVAGGLSLVLSLLLALVIAAAIARPLRRIARAAEAVAAGDYDQELRISAPDEVRRLAESFNTMTHQVKVSQQAQSDFVANVSHELKTPLTSIQGFSQALLEGATQDEESRRRAAAIIHDEASRMARLVAQLLDLARIESGQVVMARQSLDLGEVLQGCAKALELLAETAGVNRVVEIPDLPPIIGDRDRLAQVFTNLLDNALKHTPAGGKVQIAARSISGSSVVRRWPDFGKQSPGLEWVEVSVTDSGSGIPPEDLSRIFERFYQVDKSRAHRKGSAGLGLAIAKEIVEAHGGVIKAESVVGLGTRFTVTLPVAARPDRLPGSFRED
jgi:two-component system OmpR family sensor kinase